MAHVEVLLILYLVMIESQKMVVFFFLMTKFKFTVLK